MRFDEIWRNLTIFDVKKKGSHTWLCTQSRYFLTLPFPVRSKTIENMFANKRYDDIWWNLLRFDIFFQKKNDKIRQKLSNSILWCNQVSHFLILMKCLSWLCRRDLLISDKIWRYKTRFKVIKLDLTIFEKIWKN